MLLEKLRIDDEVGDNELTIRPQIALVQKYLAATFMNQSSRPGFRRPGGVKLPFHWTVTWLDGRSTIELSELQSNVPIDAAKFSKPAPAMVTKAVAR